MKTTVLAAVRLALAAASVAGVVTQVVLSVQVGFSLVSVFSYFTILSNLFASAVFVIGAVRLLRGTPSSRGWEVTRGASVVYLAFVGLVFNTLLAGADLGELLPWVNVVHHMLVPAAVVIDWFVDRPRYRQPFSMVWAAAIIPAVYTAYTLVRGALIGFYPYPFFNPARVGGYGGVALYCVALLIGFLVLALLTRATGNAMARRTAAPETSER